MWSGPEVWPLGSPPLGGAGQGAQAGSQAWAFQKGQRSGTLLWWKSCTGGTAVFERNHWIFWPCLCPHCKCALGHRPACTAGVGLGPGSKLSLPFPTGPLSHDAAEGGLLLVEPHAFLSSSLCSPTRGLLLLGRLPGGGWPACARGWEGEVLQCSCQDSHFIDRKGPSPLAQQGAGGM